MAPTPEAVFAARTSADERAAERALTAAGIAYSVATEATEKPDGAVCFLSMVYRVGAEDAARARTVLETAGLGAGVLRARG